jgi:hypothetical protein
MAKQLELKKLLDQLVVSYVVTQVEPNRYVVNESFKVFISDQHVKEFQIRGPAIRISSWVPKCGSCHEYSDVVEYALYKEI